MADPVKDRTRQMHATLRRRAGKEAVMSLDELRVHYAYRMEARPLCPYCNAKLTCANVSLDHMTPVGRGGTHAPENLAFCCRSCNKIKGEMTDVEFTDFLRTLHGWSVRQRNLKLYDDVLSAIKVGNSFRLGANRRAKKS